MSPRSLTKYLQIHKSFFIVVFGIGLLLGWSVALLFISPEEIIEVLSFQGGYVVAFLMAALGGVSTFTSAAFFTAIVTLSQGGLDPLYLALIAGTGLTIGDSLFYFLGMHGRRSFSQKIQQKIQVFGNWIKKHSDALVAAVIFAYASIIPLPNDILAVALAFGQYEYWKAVLPLLVGNMIFIFLVSSASI